MNIDYLREFAVLAQRLNFTETAAEFNLTQPALSKHISALEHEFDAELLDRSPGNVQLSESGRVLFEAANDIIDRYDSTKLIIDNMKTRPPLRLAGDFSDMDLSSFISMIAMLAREHYNLPISFNRGQNESFRSVLQNEEIDAYIGYVDPEEVQAAGYSCFPLSADRLVAIVGTYHPLADRESISLADLRDETLVHIESNNVNAAWQQISTALQAHGLSPKLRTISAISDVEFFTVPLHGSVLIWKQSYRQLRMLSETGYRKCVPIIDEDACLKSYVVCTPEREGALADFLKALEEAKQLLNQRRNNREAAE